MKLRRSCRRGIRALRRSFGTSNAIRAEVARQDGARAAQIDRLGVLILSVEPDRRSETAWHHHARRDLLKVEEKPSSTRAALDAAVALRGPHVAGE